MAQLGSALALGARGRGFKSRHPDQLGFMTCGNVVRVSMFMVDLLGPPLESPSLSSRGFPVQVSLHTSTRMGLPAVALGPKVPVWLVCVCVGGGLPVRCWCRSNTVFEAATVRGCHRQLVPAAAERAGAQ